MSQLVKQAGILSIADFSRVGVKALIGFALARIFTQADYGTYRQLYLVYTTFSAILLLGLPQSILYFYPKMEDSTRKEHFIKQTMLLFVGLGMLFCLGIFTFRVQIGALFHNQGLPVLLLLFCFYPIFAFFSMAFNYYLLASQRSTSVAKFTIFSVLTEMTLVLATAAITHDLFYTTIAIIGVSFIQFLYAFISIKDLSFRKVPIDRELIRHQLHFSLPLGLASILGILAIQLDKIVISSFYSPEIFAVFSVGAMEIPLMSIVLNSVNSVIMPEMAKLDIAADRDKVESMFRSAARNNALMIFPMCIFFFAMAQDFIVILYSNRYLEAAQYFRIYLVALPLRIVLYGVLLQISNKTRFILYTSVFSLALNLLLNLILVHFVGKVGPAWATVIVIYATIILYLHYFRKILHLRLRNLFPVPDLLKTFLVALLAGLPLYFVLMVPINAWIRFFVAFAIYASCYLGLGVLFNVIKPYDRQLIRSILTGVLQKLKPVRHAGT